MYDRILGEYWNTWVGLWVAWNVREGHSVTNHEDILDESGLLLPTTLILGNSGVDTNYPGHINLFAEEFVSGKEFAKSIELLLTKADKKWRPDETGEQITVESASRYIVYEAAIDMSTLKPAWAKRIKYVKTKAPNEDEVRQKEVREYRFNWVIPVAR